MKKPILIFLLMFSGQSNLYAMDLQSVAVCLATDTQNFPRFVVKTNDETLISYQEVTRVLQALSEFENAPETLTQLFAICTEKCQEFDDNSNDDAPYIKPDSFAATLVNTKAEPSIPLEKIRTILAHAIIPNSWLRSARIRSIKALYTHFAYKKILFALNSDT